MGVEHNQPAHLLDRYVKGGDINGCRLYIIVKASFTIIDYNGTVRDALTVTTNLLYYHQFHVYNC